MHFLEGRQAIFDLAYSKLCVALDARQRGFEFVAGHAQELVHPAVCLAQRELAGARIGAFAQQAVALDGQGCEFCNCFG